MVKVVGVMVKVYVSLVFDWILMSSVVHVYSSGSEFRHEGESGMAAYEGYT